MILDARSIPSGETLEADICIVGAGAAGISLAREFIGTDVRVLLLESGGMKFNHRTQFLYRGEIVGRHSIPLDFTRRRQFGGSTVIWSGRCRPLDASDFEARGWIPKSGWPFSFQEVVPYYQRAAAVLEIDSDQYAPAFWDAKENYPGFGGAGPLETKIFHSSPPTKFDEKYRAELSFAENVQTLLWANVVHIQADGSGDRVKSIRCSTLRKNVFEVKAKKFVLAVGGLETARLLLASRDVHPDGLGNQSGLVGRCFMDHIHFFDGLVTEVPPHLPPSFFNLDYSSSSRNVGMTRAVGLTEEYRRKNQLLNACAFFVRRSRRSMDDRFFSSSVRDFVNLVDEIRYANAPTGKILGNFWKALLNSGGLLPLAWQMLLPDSKRPCFGIHMQLECVPTMESRVYLSDKKDALGMPRLKLDWRLTRQDLENYRRFREILFNQLEGLGFRTRKINHELDREGWPVSMVPAKHHSGTTRMSVDPREGVVDPDCRVHGLSNLFIAGGSVFPTSGMANPMLTTVALSLRLADHLKNRVMATADVGS